MKDKRIDIYIESREVFAQPILSHLRALVHKVCPEVKETMKWSLPHFDYKGVMCGMAAFKEHCVFGFWKAALIKGLQDSHEKAMGHFGRITSLSDLPNDEVLIAYIREAMDLNERGIKLPKKAPKEQKALELPEDFLNELQKNANAHSTFENFSASKKREYVEWVMEAKQEKTRKKRIETAISYLSEGKSLHWKYQ